MALFGGLDKTNFLSEFLVPIDTQAGVITPAVQQRKALENLGFASAYQLISGTAAGAVLNTAGVMTYTAAQLLGGIILRDPNGAGRSDTLPTAQLLVAAIPGAIVGTIVRTTIINTADAAETITLLAGSGGAFTQLAATAIIPQNSSKELIVRITNVTASSEAYVAYI